MANKQHVSPSVNFTEENLTFIKETFGITKLGIAGETKYGRAFTPIKVSDYESEFKVMFGGLDPCTFKNSENLKYESAYIAKEFLSESDELYMSRILGLSGYDAGDSWSITVAGGLDKMTVASGESNQFVANVQYINGKLNNVSFSNQILQELYDNGKIDDSIFGTVNLTLGEEITLSDTLLGNCVNFEGARFNATLTDIQEEMICISASTMTVSTENTTQEVQDCVVVYQGGSITYNSTFLIDVNNTIILINQGDNSINVINNGILRVDGGTIEHYSDGSIIFTNCTFYLPNGESFSGGVYKICDLNNNNGNYDCTNINGENISTIENTENIVIPVTTTGVTVVETNVPSGVITHTFSGEMTFLQGQPLEEIDNSIVLTLRSYASYDNQERLSFNLKDNSIAITSINGGKINPLDDFKIYGVLNNGVSFNYIVSFDRNKKNYIGRVFGKSAQLCCDNNTPFYIEELYINMLEKWIAEGKVDCIKPTICNSKDFSNFKTQYRGAKTPWIVSEVRGNKVFRLFRFHTFSDGDNANDQIKISIENIKPDTGEFDIKVRQFYDNDATPTVLETFARCNMNKQSNNYIANRIGDFSGKYDLKSKYIIVEMDADCLAETFPCGFEGYPLREYTNCKEPKIVYKTSYLTTERTRKVYLGLSDTLGIEKDFFDFKGLDANGNDWSKKTKGFHMDVNAQNVSVEGLNQEDQLFETGIYAFQNEDDLTNTDYEKLVNRKFTVAPYGGFDGWDIFRPDRTNGDSYSLRGINAEQGLTSGAFDTLAWEDGQTVLNSDYYAYLKGIRTFSNPESIYVNLFTCASIDSVNHSDLVEETISMIEEERCDAFYVFNTPDYLSDGSPMLPDDISESIDGLFETSWGATYAYWGLYNDTENNTKIWLPPTANVLKSFAYTDKVKAPWYAAAGTQRALTNFTNVRYKTKISDRDTLIEGRINPLFYDNKKIYIWGNSTLQSEINALKSINVRRLLLHIRKLFANISVNILFEQNSSNVRSRFRDLIRPILEDIQRQEGISQFEIEIDESPESIDRAELNGKICISPIRSIETINIGFCLKNTGAEFDNI